MVGLMLDKSLDSTVAIMAIWKLGWCYVPLDSKAPPLRLEYQIQQASATVVLANKQTAIQSDRFAGILFVTLFLLVNTYV